MNPVVHFEIPYKSSELMIRFYQSTFGWKLNPLGTEMDSYILATTATEDVKPGSPTGSINGGFYRYKADWPSQVPSIVIGVSDINQCIAKISKNGGDVLGKPMEIPGTGLYVSFLDPEGNRLSILQPQM